MLRLALALLVLAPLGCGPQEMADGRDDSFFGGGKADGALSEGDPEARAVLALVNDPAVSFEILDDDVRLDRRAARGIVHHRAGPDGTYGTADDDPFDTLAELDDVPWVGPVAFERLLEYALANGYLGQSAQLEVVFSPQPYDQSHNVRVAELIDGAQHSLDIAMYSYSDARIADALERAVDRGVKVRFLFETGHDDAGLTGAALESSKSGRLERMGINVRYVNKIMHHKLVIADGPRDDVSRADTARVATGSGNWSWGAATIYDENTVFFQGIPELVLRLQREFNLLWEHSRDVVVDPTLPYELSTARIADADITDVPDAHAWFTSANFRASGTTFYREGRDEISSQLVAAIERADASIWIASGHLRSRPVAEALMARRAADPSLDIRVYLDGQEYISSWYHGEQLRDLDDCLASATTETQIRNCYDKGFYFGYQVGQTGIEVRYKYYAYRWHYSYAKQMHHKYLIIDGDELFTGSYNLSDNAEHNTFENMLYFAGPAHAALIDAYEANFLTIWETGRAEGLYQTLLDRVAADANVPLVFAPMALTWDEVEALKDAIRENCPDINSEPYRTRPEDHWVCPRE